MTSTRLGPGTADETAGLGTADDAARVVPGGVGAGPVAAGRAGVAVMGSFRVGAWCVYLQDRAVRSSPRLVLIASA